jgi:1-pyrroline-5-carboxylate dehydrogenase
MAAEFRNEPFTDFTKEENAQAMREAIQKVQSQLGREYPLVIGGERIATGNLLESINPANRTQIVGRFNKATKELASRAVDEAAKAFETWKHTPAADRAELLFRAAAIMRERKHELSAWMIHEVAKTWAEADGDTYRHSLEVAAFESLRGEDLTNLLPLALRHDPDMQLLLAASALSPLALCAGAEEVGGGHAEAVCDEVRAPEDDDELQRLHEHREIAMHRICAEHAYKNNDGADDDQHAERPAGTGIFATGKMPGT